MFLLTLNPILEGDVSMCHHREHLLEIENPY